MSKKKKVQVSPPDKETSFKEIKSIDDAVVCIGSIKDGYKNAESDFAQFLENFRAGLFIAPESLYKTTARLLSVYWDTKALAEYGSANSFDFIGDGKSLDDIISQLNKVKAFDEKIDIVIHMAYILFEDMSTNIVYDPVRLGLKQVVMSGDCDSEALKNIELLENGFATRDPVTMFEIFNRLDGVYDAKILSNILVKKYTVIEGSRDTLLKGLESDDDVFLSIVYSRSRAVNEYNPGNAMKQPGNTGISTATEPVGLPGDKGKPNTDAKADAETGHTKEGSATGKKPKVTAGTKKTPEKDAGSVKAERKDPLPDGGIVQETPGSGVTDAQLSEEQALRQALSILSTEKGAKGALSFISNEAEKNADLLFTEEQMLYAFGSYAESEVHYTFNSIFEVFGEEADSPDLFGAAVLSYAFSDSDVYDYDLNGIRDMISEKYPGCIYGDSLKNIFTSTCRFKEENGTDILSSLAGRTNAEAVLEEVRNTCHEITDYKKMVSNGYQKKNPFLNAMVKIGFGEINQYLDQFAEAENKAQPADQISDFLKRNHLVAEGKTPDDIVPDTDGIDAYKDGIWNEYIKTPDGKKRFSNAGTLNDPGKSHHVNKYYLSGVKLLIKCLRISSDYSKNNVDGYLRAKEAEAGMIDLLKELAGSGYKATGYMANMFLEDLEKNSHLEKEE